MTRLAGAELFDAKPFRDACLDAADVLRIFQQALEHGRNALAEYHLETGHAATLVKRSSWLTDQLLIQAWRRFFPAPGNSPSLIATGGYGRAQLNPASDIDLLILLPGRADKSQLETTEAFIRFCWDMGLKVGHSARTLQDSMHMAAQNLTVMTNMMEARLICGNPACFAALQNRLRRANIWPTRKYVKAKLEEQQARHVHFGGTAYNLEPNIKESPGGLRDLHMISWVANRYFGTGDFAELVEHEFLTRQEYRALIRCRDFLWKVRNGLHLLTARCEDRFLFDYQRELAKQLGFRQQGGHLAVENMMKRYYRTAKEVQLLNEISLQHFEEAILSPKKPGLHRINDRFNAVGGYLEAARPDLFETRPGALLEMFHLMQKLPDLVGVRASTIRQVRGNLHRIDSRFRKDPENRSTFLDIFRFQQGLTHALRRMNAYGVLGKFFPEFDNVVGQMQHDLFHVFTVDAHSLFTVGNLRKLMLDKYRREFPVLRAVIGKMNRRERLYLAALCHDIGKGSGRDHSIAGEEIALKLCRRLQLSEYDSRFVAWLVRNHLIMSWTAQKEDTSDQHVIDRFAERIGDQEHLDNLYLLTVADIRATGPVVWSEWKGRLLSNLYSATSRRLRSGISGPQAITKRVDDRKQAIRKLVAESIPESRLFELWEQLDQEYFLRNGPETCAWHARQICNANLLELPLVAIRQRPEIRARQILVVTPDADGLLSRSTAAIDRLGLSILDARIHCTRSGLGILTFVTDTPDEKIRGSHARIDQIGEIRRLLLSTEDYVPVRRTVPRAVRQFNVPISITFSDNVSPRYTIMEIVCQDRPGLLYHVSVALLECKVRLISAKVSTVGEKAEDTFFITDRDGNPVESRERRSCLQSRLQEYLG